MCTTCSLWCLQGLPKEILLGALSSLQWLHPWLLLVWVWQTSASFLSFAFNDMYISNPPNDTIYYKNGSWALHINICNAESTVLWWLEIYQIGTILNDTTLESIVECNSKIPIIKLVNLTDWEFSCLSIKSCHITPGFEFIVILTFLRSLSDVFMWAS